MRPDRLVLESVQRFHLCAAMKSEVGMDPNYIMVAWDGDLLNSMVSVRFFAFLIQF